jgi:hypothetical protein
MLLLALAVMRSARRRNSPKRRRAEDRSRLSLLVRQELLTRLEGIALRAASGQATPRDREVALAARLAARRV